MFSRMFWKYSKPLLLSTGLLFCCNLEERSYWAVERKGISQKELHNLMLRPQYYVNSLILLNSKKQELCNVISKSSKCYQLGEQEQEGSPLPQNYDLIAVNGEGDCRLFKVEKNHDILKIQNFMKGMPVLEQLGELKELLKEGENKIVLSYLPRESPASLSEKQENPLDQFARQNKKDVRALEEHFKELRYANLDKNACHMLIREQAVASQLGLSSNDVGLVYVIKKTDFSKESSFVWDGQEYLLTRVEHDPNLEAAADLQETLPNEYRDQWFKVLGLQKNDLPSQVYSVDKYLKRLTLKQLPYVSHVYSDQQLNNLMVVAKQINVHNLLIYGLADDRNIAKVQRKLLNLKRSLNTHQQENLMIVISENEDILHKYFGVVSDNVHDQIRLIRLNEKQVIDEASYETVSLKREEQQELRLKDISEEMLEECLRSERFRYFGKVTTGRLKYFLQQSAPDLGIKNVLSPRESDLLLFARYRERTEEQTKHNVVTSRDITQHLDKCIVYFYKPHCNGCRIMADSINNISDVIDQLSRECVANKTDKLVDLYRIKNLHRFANLKIVRYNILNENLDYASPTKSPLLYYYENGQAKQLDFIQDRIRPDEEERLLRFIIRTVDNL